MVIAKVTEPKDRTGIKCPTCGETRLVLTNSVVSNPQQYKKGMATCIGCAARQRAHKMAQAQARRPFVDNPLRVRPAERPTFALPGTIEKMAVMAERYRTGQELHHPKDAGVVSTTRKEIAWVLEVVQVSIDERERLKGNAPLVCFAPVIIEEDD